MRITLSFGAAEASPDPSQAVTVLAPPSGVMAVFDNLPEGEGAAEALEVARLSIVERLGPLRVAISDDGEMSKPQLRAAFTEALAEVSRDVGRAVAGAHLSVTAVVAAPGLVAVAHVGHTEGYLLRAGEVLKLTRPHTFGQRMADGGARVDAPFGDRAWQGLGQAEALVPHLIFFKPRAADAVLLMPRATRRVLLPVDYTRASTEGASDSAAVSAALLEAAARRDPDGVPAVALLEIRAPDEAPRPLRYDLAWSGAARGASVDITAALSAVLEDCPLLAGLDATERMLVLGRASTSALHAGDVLFTRGEPADSLSLVLIGELRAEDRSDAWRTGVHGVVGHGALVGERTRLSTVRAATDARVLTIPSSELNEVIAAHPRIGLALYRNTARLLLRRSLALDELLEAD